MLQREMRVKLLEKTKKRARRQPARMRGMWEFRTGRQDVPLAWISPDFRSGVAEFTGQPREKRLCRLTADQLRALLAHDASQFLRPRGKA